MQEVLDYLGPAEGYLGSAVFLLLGIFLPILYKKIYDVIMRHIKSHVAEWFHILFTSYAVPTEQILRALFIYLALYTLPLRFNNDTYKSIIRTILIITVIICLGLGAWRASPMCHLIFRRAQRRLDIPINKTLDRFLENVFRVLVGVVTGIAVLDALGVPVAGLMTSAGIAGLALSLAAQSTLSSLIAGVALVLEHPFDIGDYIVIGSYEGTVEDIAFRSTKIRTPDNVAITIENSEVASSYIQNCSQRTSRLWQFTLALTYDTPPRDMREICVRLHDAISSFPGVKKDGVSVTFDQFNSYSVDLLARVYTASADYGEFLQLKSDLNVLIKRIVEESGLSFAFPTTTVDLAASGEVASAEGGRPGATRSRGDSAAQ